MSGSCEAVRGTRCHRDDSYDTNAVINVRMHARNVARAYGGLFAQALFTRAISRTLIYKLFFICTYFAIMLQVITRIKYAPLVSVCAVLEVLIHVFPHALNQFLFARTRSTNLCSRDVKVIKQHLHAAT